MTPSTNTVIALEYEKLVITTPLRPLEVET